MTSWLKTVFAWNCRLTFHGVKRIVGLRHQPCEIWVLSGGFVLAPTILPRRKQTWSPVLFASCCKKLPKPAISRPWDAGHEHSLTPSRCRGRASDTIRGDLKARAFRPLFSAPTESLATDQPCGNKRLQPIHHSLCHSLWVNIESKGV